VFRTFVYNAHAFKAIAIVMILRRSANAVHTVYEERFRNRLCCGCSPQMRSLLLHLASFSALQVHSFPLAHQITPRRHLQSTRMTTDKSDSTTSSEATADPKHVPEPAKAVWDAINGIWQGSKAARDDHDLPDPLWIFGYGSLCWKPEDGWKE
jgi:hypothetical protein